MIKHRVTVLTTNSVESNTHSDKNNNKDELYLSRGKWVLPSGEYQRQDRFTFPGELLFTKNHENDNGNDNDNSQLTNDANEQIGQFAIQWRTYNTSIIANHHGVRAPQLANLNNAFSKFIEPGYSIFFAPEAGAGAEETKAGGNTDAANGLDKKLKLLNDAQLNDFNVTAAQFVRNPVAWHYFGNESNDNKNDELPAKLQQRLVDLICQKEPKTTIKDGKSLHGHCVSNYKKLLPKATSVSLEYANPLIYSKKVQQEDAAANDQVVLTLHWNAGSLTNFGSTIYKSPEHYQREIGLFEIDHRASQVNDLNLYGLTAELPSPLPPAQNEDGTAEGESTPYDEDKDIRVAQKTMFYLHPRHLHLSKLAYNSSFKQPVGLHPVHQVSLKIDADGDSDGSALQSIKRNTTSGKLSLQPPMNNKLFDCELYSYYRLPNQVFLDKNEYADSKDKDDANLKLLGVWGETDLEKPSYKVDKWGSDALFRVNVETRDDNYFDIAKELKLPISGEGKDQDSVDLYEVKLHSRYQSVTNTNNSTIASIPKPDLFWACEASKYKLALAVQDHLISETVAEDLQKSFNDQLIHANPLDNKLGLNLDGLFTNNTVFFHFDQKFDIDNATDLLKGKTANNNAKDTKLGLIKPGTITNDAFQDKFHIPAGNANDFISVQFLTLLAVVLSLIYFVKKFYNGYAGGLVTKAEPVELIQAGAVVTETEKTAVIGGNGDKLSEAKTEVKKSI